VAGRLTRAAPALLAGLLLTGCSPGSTTSQTSAAGSPALVPASPSASGSDPSAGASASAPIPPSPVANPVINAMSISRSLGTAQADIDVANSVDGAQRMLTGNGVVDVGRGWSDITWTADGTARELVTRDGIFLSTDDEHWLAFPNGTPTSRVADVFAGLPDVPAWVLDGTEQIGTTEQLSTKRYTGTLPAGADALGLNDQETADALAGGSRVAVTVWIDDQGRIVRILRVLTDPQQGSGNPDDAADGAASPPLAITATTLINLTNYGLAAPISTPDESLISTP